MGKPASVKPSHQDRPGRQAGTLYRDTAESGETYDVEMEEEKAPTTNDRREDDAQGFLKQQRENAVRAFAKKNR